MGNYLNPGNDGFRRIRNDLYVDKSGMIGLLNQTIETPRNLTCISRPRRFGKSFAAQMLCAYYDKTCDSSELFEDLEIARDPKWRDGYKEHLNQYNVIYLDMSAVLGAVKKKEDIVSFVIRNVTQELIDAYPSLKVAEAFYDTLANAVPLAKNRFVIIIDERGVRRSIYSERRNPVGVFQNFPGDQKGGNDSACAGERTDSL